MIGMRMLGHATAELRAHPGRALLSGVSLFIGVLAVVAISTVARLTHEVFIATVEQEAGRRITAEAEVELPGHDAVAEIRTLLAALHPVDLAGGGVAITAAGTGSFGQLGRDELEGAPLTGPNASVSLVAGELHRVRRLPLLQGRWFPPDSDIPVEAVLNISGAGLFGGPGSRILWAATEDEPPLVVNVVGVIADGGASPNLYLPLVPTLVVRPGLLEIGQDGDTTIRTTVLVHHPTASIDVLSELVRRAAAATGGKAPPTAIRVDRVDYFLNQLAAQQRAFLAIAILALAISAIGILNIGLAGVSERTRELVIRRAVGARRVDLVAQLLLASVAVGFFAAAVAVAVAYAGVVGWAPGQIRPESAIVPPGFPWTAAALGLVAATGTTLIGAIIPALVASRLDVANALRD